MSFDAVFRLHRQARPGHVALIDGERHIDYRTLDRLVDGAAHAMASSGVARGQLVGVALPDDAAHVVGLLALARLGAVILPMDCRWPAMEKRTMAGQFDADHVLLDPTDPAIGAAPGWVAAPALTRATPPISTQK